MKDLTRLGRDLKDIIIVDNSPVAYLFQPENAIPAVNWYDDPDDTELPRIATILERLVYEDDVRRVIKSIISNNKIDPKQEQIYLSSTNNQKHKRDQSQRVDRRKAPQINFVQPPPSRSQEEEQAIMLANRRDAYQNERGDDKHTSKQYQSRNQTTATQPQPHSRYESSDYRQKQAALI